MSGEWSDGAERLVQELGERLESSPKPLHAAFGKRLIEMAGALRALSLELSSDTAEGSADTILQSVVSAESELNEAVRLADIADAALRESLRRARSLQRATDTEPQP